MTVKLSFVCRWRPEIKLLSLAATYLQDRHHVKRRDPLLSALLKDRGHGWYVLERRTDTPSLVGGHQCYQHLVMAARPLKWLSG